MSSPIRSKTSSLVTVLLLGLTVSFGTAGVSPPQSDLDAFMERVLARRDENWKKLQQYVLDEREATDVLGPGRTPLFGMRREYTWFIRDGYFVRSPVRFDGVTLDEAERRRYEDQWVEQERKREARGAERGDAGTPPPVTDVGSLISATREPQFVSAAYFLKFKFEPGRYAFVGREPFEGTDVLRIEYYPTKLFADEETKDGHGAQRDHVEDPEDEIERKMNKVALVTLWIEPGAHQIVKYTFENVDFDFLPGRFLVRIDEAVATMRMGEAFPDVWLPRDVAFRGAVTLASGTFEVRYGLSYANYRQADVSVTIK